MVRASGTLAERCVRSGLVPSPRTRDTSRQISAANPAPGGPKTALTDPKAALTAEVERRRARPRSILIVRAGIAAAVAFVIAQWLHCAPAPVLAPLTALLVVQATVQDTLVSGLQRLLSVSAGVVLAATLSSVIGLTPLTLGVAVVAALVLGKVLRLGPNVVEVPISALVILAVHGQAAQAHLRIGETIVGTLVGIGANLILLPPVYLEPSVRAVRDLAMQTQELLLMMSLGVRDGWSSERAQTWLASSRALSDSTIAARAILERGEQSARFNPRGRPSRIAWPELTDALTAQEHVVYTLRGVCRSLADRDRAEGAGCLPDSARLALAETLEPLSDGVLLVAPWLIDEPGDPVARPELAHVLERARTARDGLRRALVVDAVETPQMWQANGALLALLDQLLRDLEAVSWARGLVRTTEAA